MELALYDPSWGYYAKAAAPGRRGDFFTSVSVGSCFGQLLAIYFHQIWEARGCPAAFEILEQGGHGGTLASDILEAISANFPAFYREIRFRAFDRSPPPRLDPRLTEHRCWAPVSDLSASFPASVDLAFSNELLDAFPVHRVTWQGPEVGWEEAYVVQDSESGALRFTHGPPSCPELEARLADIETVGFEPGYTTEVNLGIAPWLGVMARALKPGGKLLIIDYGLSQDAYYSPSRREGTLQAYHRHRRASDPLARPGEQDLTAQVNFTQVEELANRLGLRVTRFEQQHRFLTSLAREPLLDMEKSLAGSAPRHEARRWVRQFQQLISMGPEFKVMELTNAVGSA